MENITERILEFNKNFPCERTIFKLETMTKNAFRFYRATNHIFYEDLVKQYALPVSPPGWISGDLHLENFGTYKSSNRVVYFDLNDFDEAILAPVALELQRMVTGIMVAFNSLHIEEKKAVKMSHLFLDSYALTLSEGKPTYIEPQTAGGILKNFLLAAENRRHKKMLAKKTVNGKAGRQLSLEYDSHKKLQADLRMEIIEHVTKWLQQDDGSPYNYRAVDAVFRLAGVGSVGVNRYVVLLESKNNEGEKYMLLDMKQARGSALSPYITQRQPQWKHEAERVVRVQERMQNRSPALLSMSLFRNDSYVMEEMQSAEDKIDFKLIKHDYREMCRVISNMGSLTAAAQLRSSGRDGSATADDLIQFGKNMDSKELLVTQAIDLAHQMNAYYLQFLRDDPKSVFKKNMKANKVLTEFEPQNTPLPFSVA